MRLGDYNIIMGGTDKFEIWGVHALNYILTNCRLTPKKKSEKRVRWSNLRNAQNIFTEPGKLK
jgi:hypothetical protein